MELFKLFTLTLLVKTIPVLNTVQFILFYIVGHYSNSSESTSSVITGKYLYVHMSTTETIKGGFIIVGVAVVIMIVVLVLVAIVLVLVAIVLVLVVFVIAVVSVLVILVVVVVIVVIVNVVVVAGFLFLNIK